VTALTKAQERALEWLPGEELNRMRMALELLQGLARGAMCDLDRMKQAHAPSKRGSRYTAALESLEGRLTAADSEATEALGIALRASRQKEADLHYPPEVLATNPAPHIGPEGREAALARIRAAKAAKDAASRQPHQTPPQPLGGTGQPSDASGASCGAVRAGMEGKA
jgi:hypothetical protein